MEVKIGIQSIPRELVVDTDTPVEEIERALSDALAGAAGQSAALTMPSLQNSPALFHDVLRLKRVADESQPS